MNKQTRKIFYISVYFNHEKLTLGYMRQIKYKAVISVKIYRKKKCKRFRRRQGQNQHILQSSILIENSKTTTESTVTDLKKKR